MADTVARLIAVDGIDGRAIAMAARIARAKAHGGRVSRVRGGGVSRWDASGLFEQLMMAEDEAGQPSARTLLLLYAADLVFRLRWQIQPALAEGTIVVAAPYVDTAVAFGRAAGLPGGWLRSLFGFAPKPDATEHVVRTSRRPGKPAGFVEFASALLSAHPPGLTRAQLLDSARTHLRSAASRAARVTHTRQSPRAPSRKLS